jgi:hypothetical protein
MTSRRSQSGTSYQRPSIVHMRLNGSGAWVTAVNGSVACLDMSNPGRASYTALESNMNPLSKKSCWSGPIVNFGVMTRASVSLGRSCNPR